MSQTSSFSNSDTGIDYIGSFAPNSGTDPVVPTAGGLVNILGSTASAGTAPLTTVGSLNTLTITAQRSQALASADSTKVGLSNFDSTDFAVDANGFVSLAGAPGGFTACAFSSYLTGTQSNVTGDNTLFYPVYDGVLTNVGSAYDSATGIFTAPATGVYTFGYITCYGELGNANASINAFLSGAPENFNFRVDQYNGVGYTSAVTTANGNATIPLTAGTTLRMLIAAYGTTKTVDVLGGGLASYATTSMFFGYRVA